MSKYRELENKLKKSPHVWLVTGAAGFIGSNLVEKLLILDQKVISLDDCQNTCKGVDYVLHQAGSWFGAPVDRRSHPDQQGQY